jgi:hypothetical protein
MAVPAVDEQQAERGGPPGGHGDGATHHQHHVVLQAGLGQGPPGPGQRVHPAGGRVDQVGLVVLPAGLVLLRAAVVVHAEEHRPPGARCGAQVDGGLPAVGADLEQRTEPVGHGDGAGVVQGQPLVGRHEAADRLRQLPLLRGQPSTWPIMAGAPTAPATASTLGSAWWTKTNLLKITYLSTQNTPKAAT